MQINIVNQWTSFKNNKNIVLLKTGKKSWNILIITHHKRRFNNISSIEKIDDWEIIDSSIELFLPFAILTFRYSEANFPLFASRQGMILSGIFLPSASRRHRHRRYRDTVTIVDVKSREGTGERKRERERENIERTRASKWDG